MVHGVLAVLAAVFLLPLVWMVVAAFDAEPSLRAAPPASLTLDHFSAVLTPETVLVPVANSVLICGGAALVTVAASLLAAYPLSRYTLRFKRPVMYVVLFATGLPITAIMVPVYGLFAQAGLLDSRLSTSLFLATASLPYGIWISKNVLDGIPIELEEAAWVDGASVWQSLRLLVLPLAVPGMAVVGIFTLVLTWGNFFVPFILLNSADRLPAAVKIYAFFDQYGGVRYGELAAYSLLYTLPVVALYLAVSRALSGRFGLGGAMKG
nr:carbohydrate ABC transporter permease [Nocardiopsis mwathae]